MIKIIKKTISGIIEIARGMLTILKHGFRKPVTLEYPEKRPELNSRFRGRIALCVKEDGSDLCTACGCCAKVCPCGDLIQIKRAKNEDNKFYPEEFTVDIGRCIFCGNCTEVCPTGAIISSNEFEISDYSRESMVYDKKRLTLTPEQSAKWKERIEKDI